MSMKKRGLKDRSVSPNFTTDREKPTNVFREHNNELREERAKLVGFRKRLEGDDDYEGDGEKRATIAGRKRQIRQGAMARSNGFMIPYYIHQFHVKIQEWLEKRR